MTSPWQILGVPSDSTVDTVRRAYAKMLRQHRPDQDPVGFRRLRDAYEIALRVAEARAAGEDVDDHDDEHLDDAGDEPPADASLWFRGEAAPPAPVAALPPTTPRPRPRPLAAPLRSALADVRAAQRSDREARLLAALVRIVRARTDDPDLAELVHEELLVTTSPLRTMVPAETVLELAIGHARDVLRALLLAHVAAADWPRLWSTVQAVEQRLEHDVGFGTIQLALATTEMVALLEPAQAERLAGRAFRGSTAAVRQMVASSDEWIHAGKQMRPHTHPETRRKLVLALCDPRVDATHPLAGRALDIALATPKATMLADLLARRFPEKAEAFSQRFTGMARRETNRRNRRRSTDEEKRSPWFYFVWGVLFIGLNLGRFCSREGRIDPNRESSRRHYEEIIRKAKQRIEDSKPDSDGESRPRDGR